ncbi:unnamed protein product [Prunus brigantina]
MIMPHEFRGHLNRVVRGLRLRLTNGPLRPARNATWMDLVSPGPARIAAQIEVLSLRPARNAARFSGIFCPTSLRVIWTVRARIADQVDQMSPESSGGYRSGRVEIFGKCSIYRGDSAEFSAEVKLEINCILNGRAIRSFAGHGGLHLLFDHCQFLLKQAPLGHPPASLSTSAEHLLALGQAYLQLIQLRLVQQTHRHGLIQTSPELQKNFGRVLGVRGSQSAFFRATLTASSTGRKNLAEVHSSYQSLPSSNAEKLFQKRPLLEHLELIHSDVCGPMQTTTKAGNCYFLTFIDDCTRMCWVYFLRHKSDVFHVFNKFKATVELQNGYKVKKLRSDRGGEYTSKEFNRFCDEMGMERQLTVAYSP